MKIKIIEKFCPICNNISIHKIETTREELKASFKIEHVDVATSVARISVECINCVK